ncbi:MAG: sterol desaturase family protein [Bacteroidota bacterium]|jgi:sterol desaturase/sphingolipid hydroxylase (fatty acid hydroxylase superfamily)|nr:sterol desaturase family protein [Bacteroidota bacterium]
MKHYVSNRKETPRMFENGLLEFFSRTHWSVPLWLFVPIILALGWLGVMQGIRTVWSFSLLLVAGLFVWTFTEYALHRFVFHYEPRSAWGRRVHWMFHGVHHDYPSDPLRLVMVPGVSVPLGTLFFLLFLAVLDVPAVYPFAAGFFIGYLFYDTTHYAVHHFPIKGRVFGRLRELHMRHHFQQPDRGFGVSSPLWDLVFGTTLAQQNKSTQIES